MTDEPEAKQTCPDGHAWAAHCGQGKSVNVCYLCGAIDWADLDRQIRAATSRPPLLARIVVGFMLTLIGVIGIGALATIAGWVWHAARLAWS